MPIYLPAARLANRGPDGRGLNRLRIDIRDPQAQCALKPRTIRKLLLESYATVHAVWGNFHPCTRKGQCDTCPLRTDPPRLGFRAERLAVRIDEQGQAWLMNHLEKGWASYGERVSLTTLANAVDYWFADGRKTRIERDADSEYLWLTKVAA